MNTDHLRTFLALADTGSFRKAADLLYLTPPAIKYTLDTLESETGLTLFTRSHAGLVITESGTVFADYATQMLSLFSECISHAADASSNEQQIIDAPWMPLPVKDTLYLSAFSAFQTAHPEIDLEFREVRSFIGEHYDAINSFADVAHTHAVEHPLSLLPLYCTVAKNHPLAARDSVTIGELSPYRLLIPHQELIDHLDERTKAFLSSIVDSVEHMDARCQDSSFFQWCRKEQRVALVIGKWPRGDSSVYTEFIPIDGASFENCVFTQKNPSSAVTTYVKFLQAFYANAESLVLD